jgi:3-oxosteroid 1-dehydrogenase
VTEAPQYDAVLVGASAGSLVAALKLSAAGLRVLIVEKSELVGGGTAYSGGIVWAPDNHRMRAKGIDDSLEAGAAYLEAIDPEDHDPEAAAVYLGVLPGLLTDLEEWTGITWVSYTGLPDYWSELPGGVENGRFLLPLTWVPPTDADTTLLKRVRAAAHAVGMESEWIWGRALLGALALAVGSADGVDLEFGVPVTDLVLDATGGPVGVDLATPDGPRRVVPRLGVLLNTGGAEWNRELVERFRSGPFPLPQTPEDNTGDGHAMALRAGLPLVRMGQTIAIPGVLVDDPPAGAPRCRIFFQPLAKPHSVVVDDQGRRFANETFFVDLAEAMSSSGRGEAVFVFDAQYVERYGLPAGVGVDVAMERADSLAELAALVGLPAAALEEDVATYNAAVLAGADDAFGRGSTPYQRVFGDRDRVPNPTTGTVAVAPFHAVRIRLTTSGHRGGLPVDPHGRVVGDDGHVVTGLYACGNIASSGLTGRAYFSGTSLGHALVQASGAADDMIARA